MRWGLGVVLLLVNIQLAHAQHPPLPPDWEPQPEPQPQPEPAPPEAPEVEPTEPDPVLEPPSTPIVVEQPLPATTVENYPRALVARPLLLPSGGLEATATMSAVSIRRPAATERVVFSPGLRLTPARVVDIDASLALRVHDSTPVNPFSPAGEAGLLHGYSLRVLGLASASTALGVQLVHAAEGSNVGIYAPHVMFVTRHRIAERSAFEVVGSAGPEVISEDGDNPIDRKTTTNFGFKLQLRVRAQVSATAALEGRAAIGATTTAAADPFMDPPFEVATFSTFGLGAVFSVTPAVDVVLGFDAVSATTEANELSIAIVARRLP